MAEDARPLSISRFGLAYLVWIVSWVLDTALRWSDLRAIILSRAPEAAGMVDSLLLGESAVAVAIAALIGWLAWRSPNGVMRWLSIAVLAIAAVLRLFGFATLKLNLVGVIWVIGLAAIVAALWFLFRPDAAAWYDRPAVSDADEAEPEA